MDLQEQPVILSILEQSPTPGIQISCWTLSSSLEGCKKNCESFLATEAVYFRGLFKG